MKKTTKFLLKINPNFLNKIKDNDLTEDIVIFALENGFDFNNDKYDRYSKFDKYIEYNFNKNKTFMNSYINSKYFDIKNITNEMIIYLKKSPNLLLSCIKKDLNFIQLLDNKCNFNEQETEELYNILKYNNINYSELNENFLENNINIGLKYIRKDFSNIVNLKKYNPNYRVYSNEIKNIFLNEIKNNIVYFNELGEFDFDLTEKEKIINTLKEIPILINDRTYSFIFENIYVNYNLIMYDLSNAKFIINDAKFNEEQTKNIIDKIEREKYIFESIPLCFKNHNEIKKAIINNNPYIMDNKDFELFHGLYDHTLNLILKDKYKINKNTNKNILNILCHDYLDLILEKDFNNIKYFENLEIRFNGKQEQLYKVLQDNNYNINNTIPICLQNNEYLIKEGLETKKLDINKLDLHNASYKEEFQLYLINYALNNNIENEVINEWKKNIISKRKNTLKDNAFYIKELNQIDNLNLPEDIIEIFISNNEISNINNVIDKVKNSNNNIKKIIIDLKDTNFTIEELKNIKDKNIVEFGSKLDVTRLTVDKLIEQEQILDLMVKDIKESNLSSYERYIAIYSIVKKFKEYKFYQESEDIDNKYDDQSRNIYLILDNDYIVCVGYANLLQNLLKRVGINSATWSVITNSDRHMRVYVNIEDKKYNINGYYMSDPTWDAIKYDKDYDNYNYLHETTKETRNDYNIKKDDKGKALLYDELFNDYTDEEMLEYLKIPHQLNYFKEKISKLDPEFYETIKDKEINIELAEIINYHFKRKINKPINKSADIQAKFELNEYIYGPSKSLEERNIKWNNLIVEGHYPLELLTEDYNEKTKELYEQLKNMKIIDYYNIIENKNTGAYYKMCLNEAFMLLRNNYLPKENDISFDIRYINARNNEKITCNIYIDNQLYSSGKIDEVITELQNKGYYIKNRNSDELIIDLDLSYKEKTFIEAYNDLNLIKQDYLRIYNNILSDRLKI